MWILRTVTEGQPEKTFRILPGNARTIGRAIGADFIIDAALVSPCLKFAPMKFSVKFFGIFAAIFTRITDEDVFAHQNVSTTASLKSLSIPQTLIYCTVPVMERDLG